MKTSLQSWRSWPHHALLQTLSPSPSPLFLPFYFNHFLYRKKNILSAKIASLLLDFDFDINHTQSLASFPNFRFLSASKLLSFFSHQFCAQKLNPFLASTKMRSPSFKIPPFCSSSLF
ncbi:uncharacterized protein DS421_19g672540 [Arachis hypogaea]|uniref:Uncharacterized protein n=1 Tax=Arachis hypogaea TaxID=3818 RepID=A0A6B9VDI5_ARAHY|nr:uncharacterized protein DS421_19g672540 [Arachis hypogaea]